MAHIQELGRRIELTSMDRHFRDISIGLYALPKTGGDQEFVLHTYSRLDGAAGRIAYLTRVMRALGGMLPGGVPNSLRFPCGSLHRLAAKRIFLEACKLAPDAMPEPLPMSTLDKRVEASVTAESLGGGRYRFAMDGGEQRRANVAAGGMRKLADLGDGGPENEIAFACGHAHDALVGLLLPRALNVRAALREYEAAAARGVLAAPSAQSGAATSF
jgi:hypothetical protein